MKQLTTPVSLVQGTQAPAPVTRASRGTHIHTRTCTLYFYLQIFKHYIFIFKH